MTTNTPLGNVAQQVRTQLAKFWLQVIDTVDSENLTAEDRAAVQRELAEIARLPWDIAESLLDGPHEELSDEAVGARARMLRYAGLGDPESAPMLSEPAPILPVHRNRGSANY